MSRQSRSRALAARRKKEKESKQTPYKTRSAWVGEGSLSSGTRRLAKQYSTDGGKTWITGKPPGGTGSGGKKLSTSVRGEQKKAAAEKEKLKVNKSEKEKKKILKKNGSSSSSSEIESDANYAKENADFNDATSGARKKRLTKEKAAADKAAKVKSDKEWLQKTSRSPAARAGIGDKQRLAARERHQKFKADRAKSKADRKAGVKKKRKLKITTWRDLE